MYEVNVTINGYRRMRFQVLNKELLDKLIICLNLLKTSLSYTVNFKAFVTTVTPIVRLSKDVNLTILTSLKDIDNLSFELKLRQYSNTVSYVNIETSIESARYKKIHLKLLRESGVNASLELKFGIYQLKALNRNLPDLISDCKMTRGLNLQHGDSEFILATTLNS